MLHGQVGLLEKDKFEIILDRVKNHIKVIKIYNWGEPFMHRDITYFFSRCTENNIATYIDTNLSTRDFTDEDAQGIVRSGLTRMQVSADGATQRSYGRYRVRGRLDRVLNNMRKIVVAKRALKSDIPFIYWKLLINRWNDGEIGLARSIAREIGVGLVFGIMENSHDRSWDSDIYNYANGILPDPYFPNIEDATAAGLMATDKAVSGPYPGMAPKTEFDLHKPTNIPDPAKPRIMNFPGGLGSFALHPQLRTTCEQPFKQLLVNYNGDVYPCCEVFDQKGDGSLAVGNLLNQTLEEIWYGEPVTACRKFLLDFGPKQSTGSICETCACPVSPKWVA
jgi:radical SAM protein with 4Fe4S-binding SPASM domain